MTPKLNASTINLPDGPEVTSPLQNCTRSRQHNERYRDEWTLLKMSGFVGLAVDVRICWICLSSPDIGPFFLENLTTSVGMFSLLLVFADCFPSWRASHASGRCVRPGASRVRLFEKIKAITSIPDFIVFSRLLHNCSGKNQWNFR